MFNRKTTRKQSRGAVRTQSAQRQQMAAHINKRWLLVFVLSGLIAASAMYVKQNWQQTVVPLEQVSIDGEFKYLSPGKIQQIK